jgi:PQQ-like domain
VRRLLGLVPALVLVFTLAPPAEATTHGAPVWIAHFAGAGADSTRSMAMSADGHEVYVTGLSFLPSLNVYDAVTVAYDAATGGELWEARYDASDHGVQGATAAGFAVLAGRTGSVVYVGISLGGPQPFKGAGGVVAYSASTGRELWVSTTPGFSAGAMALAPDGSSLVLTGQNPASGGHVFNEALDPSTGQVVWSSSLEESNTYRPELTFVPGRQVIVETVLVSGGGGAPNYSIAIGIDAASGDRLWSRQVARSGIEHINAAPDGSAVFVTAGDGTYGIGPGTGFDFLTMALDPASGSIIWSARYGGPGLGHQYVSAAIAVDPSGTRVFVTGTGKRDYTTVTYDARSGAQMWVKSFDGGGRVDYPMALGVSPDGGKVFVTGFSPDINDRETYATLAYSAASGAQVWVSRFHGTGWRPQSVSLVVSPEGHRVFLTGQSSGGATLTNYVTIAYAA